MAHTSDRSRQAANESILRPVTLLPATDEPPPTPTSVSRQSIRRWSAMMNRSGVCRNRTSKTRSSRGLGRWRKNRAEQARRFGSGSSERGDTRRILPWMVKALAWRSVKSNAAWLELHRWGGMVLEQFSFCDILELFSAGVFIYVSADMGSKDLMNLFALIACTQFTKYSCRLHMTAHTYRLHVWTWVEQVHLWTTLYFLPISAWCRHCPQL